MKAKARSYDGFLSEYVKVTALCQQARIHRCEQNGHAYNPNRPVTAHFLRLAFALQLRPRPYILLTTPL